jgi:hypothetical protein
MTLKAVTNQPVQLYAAPAYGQPGITFRVTNLDEVSTVWVDTDTTITASSTPLPPQASAVYDGSTDVWASTLSQNLIVSVDFAPGSLYYDNPVGVQIALSALGLATASNQVAQETAIPNNIAATGVPLLSNQQTMVQLATTTVSVGTPVLLPASGFSTISQIGYDGVLEFSALTTGTVLNVQHNWYEGGVQVAQDSFWIYPAAVVTPHLLYFRGPSKGSQLIVKFTAYGNAVTIINYENFQNGRIYDSDLWRTISGATFLGPGIIATATFDTPSNVIVSQEEAAVAGGGGSVQLFMPLWTGKARITLQSTSNAADASVQITGFADQNITQGYVYYGFTNAEGVLNDELVLPRAQCLMTVVNGNVNPKNLFFAITGEEY